MPRALVVGGTGLVGRATARRLLAAGWQVDLTGRDPAHLPADSDAGGRFVAAERSDAGQLLAALGDGADLLVDCICYTAADAALLLPLAHEAASTVMISSKAVYADDGGNHSNSDTAPRFDGPIPETQRTVAPGDADYTDYATAVIEEIEWLVAGGDGPGSLPDPGDPFFAPMLDYAAEDSYLARRRTTR